MPTQYTTPVVSAVGKRWRRISPAGFTYGPALLDRIQRSSDGFSFVFVDDDAVDTHTITEPGWTFVSVDEPDHPSQVTTFPTPGEVRARQRAEHARELRAFRDRIRQELGAMSGKSLTAQFPTTLDTDARRVIVRELEALGWDVRRNVAGMLLVKLPEEPSQKVVSDVSANAQVAGESGDATLPEGWTRRPDDNYGPRIAGPEGAYVERRGVGDIIVLAGRDDVLQALRAYLALLPDDPA